MTPPPDHDQDGEAYAPPSAAEDLLFKLSEPVAVYLNMLRGTIAKPSLAQIAHIYGDEWTAAIAAAEARGREQGLREAALRCVTHERGTPMHSPPQLLTEAHDAILALIPAPPAADGWQPIENAPRDGTPFQARIPGHGDDNIIAWCDGLLNSSGDECGGWYVIDEQEPPECWTDGICWEFNADDVASAHPTHWKPAPPAVQTGDGGEG